jgi:hypothetical protein
MLKTALVFSKFAASLVFTGYSALVSSENDIPLSNS